jgi:hypothetical protein
MPFDGRYDDLFREMLVLHAKGKREGTASRADMMFQEIFRKRVMEETIRRNFIEKSFYLGF